jgi:hypothetical protein
MNKPNKSLFVGKVILILLVAFFCFSCRYDNVQPIPQKVAWAYDSSFFGERKYITTSLVMNNSLLLVANTFHISNVIPTHLNKDIDGNFIDAAESSSSMYPPSLSKDISVSFINKDLLFIYRTKCASCTDQSIYFSPPYSNSTTSIKGMSGQNFYSGGNKGGYPVINSKYVLVPYEFNPSTAIGTLTLIKIDVHNLYLNVSSTKAVDIPSKPYFNYSFFCAAYYDKFFLRDFGSSWRIDTLGNAKQLPMELSEMFILNDRLFTMANSSELWVSDDRGENWSLFADVDSIFSVFQFFNVGKDLYATWEAQIWKVNMEGSEISFTELENHGLETNLITSINKCGKYAFVTTTAGLFYKDTAALNVLRVK